MKCKALFLSIFLIVSLVLPLYQTPKVKAQESSVFGNPTLPNWLNVTVTEYSANIIVDNGDGFVWEFPKDKDKFNQIYENDTLIVKDEQWLLIGEDLKEDSHPIELLEWNQPAPYHVVVKDYYQDAKKNNNFTVTYDFYGGFHPKITFNASIGTEGNYTVDWRSWVHKLNALSEPEKYHAKFWNENETGVVFNYEDVYVSFGNITELDVTGWFKGKRFDEKFNVGFLNGTFILDPSFGKTDKGGSTYTGSGICHLSEYSLPEAGTITLLTGYFKNFNAEAQDVCCGIYDGTTLIECATGQIAGNSEGWVECDISDTAQSAGTYGLAVKPRKDAIQVYYDATAATCYVDAGLGETDACPSPFGRDAGPVTRDYSVYANYTTAGEAYVADLSQSVSTAWSMLTEWDAIADFSQSVATSWSVLTEWDAILDVSQALTTSWNVLLNLNTFVDLSQAVSTTWNVLIGWDAILDFTQSLSTSWTILTQTSFNVIASLSNTFTWLVDVVRTVGGIAYIADLSQAISTTWNVLVNLNTFVDLSQAIATTWTILTQSVFNVNLAQSLATTWTVLIQSTFNIVTTLSNTFTWTVDVYHWIFTGVAYTVDLTLAILTSWTVDVLHTVGVELTSTATVGFVIVALVIALCALVFATKKGKDKYEEEE